MLGYYYFTDFTLLQYIKNPSIRHNERKHFLFLPPAYQTTSLSKYTVHTFKYLKQPQDGLYCICATQQTSLEDILLSIPNISTRLKSQCRKDFQKLTPITIKTLTGRDLIKTGAPIALLFSNSCTYGKSMLGICSKRQVTGNKNSIDNALQEAGVCGIFGTSNSVLLNFFFHLSMR